MDENIVAAPAQRPRPQRHHPLHAGLGQVGRPQLGNDRLAYGVPAAMATYGVHSNSLQAFVESGNSPHAELFPKRYLMASRF